MQAPDLTPEQKLLQAIFGGAPPKAKPPSAEQLLKTELLKKQLEEVLATLEPRQCEILKLRFGIECPRGHTLVEIGKMYGLSAEGIRRIEADVFAKLRDPMRSRKLEGFLDEPR